MNTILLDDILNRQMTVEQIEILEKFLTALEKINETDVEEAFKAEAPNHHVFDICYEEDTEHLVERVEEAFPNIEDIIEQLTCTDYWTDHDVYNSIIDERDAKNKLIAKINAWKDSVDVFLDNLDECY